MDAALAADQQLVDVGRGPADGHRRPDVAFLMAAHAHAAAAGPADIAGGERHVHERRVGPVVVVAPDQALLVAEHRPPPLAVLGLGDPGGGLDDVVGRQAGDLRRVLEASAVGGERLLEAARARIDEVPVDPALVGDIGRAAR